MMLIEETTIPSTALPVEEFKAHLRLGTGFADDSIQDAVLESFLRAAVAAIEARTGKILLEREFSWSITGWRDPDGQVLPVAPVSDLIEIALIDLQDNETILPAADYAIQEDMHQPRVVAINGCLPTIPSKHTAEVVFVAGFAQSFDGLPADLGQAVLMLAAHYYEHRNATDLAGSNLPYGVAVLLERYRSIRILGGGS